MDPLGKDFTNPRGTTDQQTPRTTRIPAGDIPERVEVGGLEHIGAMTRLTAMLGHDVHNLLGAIIGHCEIAQERLAAGHSANRNVEQIKKAAERASTLVSQLINFTR